MRAGNIRARTLGTLEPLVLCGPGAPATTDESVESRLQQAEADVLRLSSKLAERDLEVGRLFKQLEQAQVQMRARDAKVAELTRRVSTLLKDRRP